MVNVLQSIDSGHEDLIHGAEIDYYGLNLATCASDNTVKVKIPNIIKFSIHYESFCRFSTSKTAANDWKLTSKVMQVLCGKSHGHIPDSAAFSPVAVMTGRWFCGRKQTASGISGMNTATTTRRSTALLLRHLNTAWFLLAAVPTVPSRSSLAILNRECLMPRKFQTPTQSAAMLWAGALHPFLKLHSINAGSKTRRLRTVLRLKSNDSCPAAATTP